MSNNPQREEVLRGLDIQAEFEKYGVKIAAGAQPNPSGWLACHSLYRQDKNPSAAINVGSDPNLRGIYVDFGERGNGGKPQLTKSLFDVAAEFGPFMTGKDAYYRYARDSGVSAGGDLGKKNGKGKGKVVITYDYHDAAGALLFQVCRMSPKKFLQRRPVTRPDGKGDWIWDLKGVDPVPYHLPEVIPAALVYIVEGEKDADRLRSLGLVATCNPMGAGKWRPGYNPHFKGKVVVIFPDNDQAGRSHAHDVARALHKIAASVKIVELPGLPAKGDVSDWLESTGTVEQFQVLISSTPEWDPAQLPPPEIVETSLYKINSVASLNQRHAVVMLGGKCCIMNEVVDPVFGRPDVTFSSTLDFRNYYGNKTVQVETADGPVKVPLAKLWLSSPERRQYEGIVFSPGRDMNGFYNLYRGLATKPVQGDWSLMRDHIWKVIADYNEEVYHYLIAWMSRLVQDPGGERPGTSIVLRGKQGTGKGCFASQFGEIFGSHFLHITNPSHLVNRFNQHLKDALFVFVDEALWAGDRTAEGILKGMVTEKYFMCEAKGRDAFPVKNHVHLMIASNSQWVIPAGLEERRFMVLDVSDKYMQDHNYFAALFYQMDHGGREAMLYDLLETDLTTIDLRTTPQTGALLDQIIHTMPTVKKFWFERLRAGTLLESEKEWEVFVVTENLHKEYLKFSEDCGDRYRMIDRQFGKEIRALCSGIPGVKRQQLTIKEKKTWVLVFPSLEICRQRFESMVKGKINWKGDVDENGFLFTGE